MKADPVIQPAAPFVALATLGVMLGAAAFGTLPLFTRVLAEAGLAPQAIAFWRFALTALVLLPLFRVGRGRLRPTLWAMAGGAAMGLGWIGFVKSLEAMPIAEAGVLFMTYPAFAILIARLVFGERLRPLSILATALVVMAAVLAAPAGSLGGGTGAAVALALLAPAAYGLLINILAYKLQALRPLAVVGAVALGSVLALAPLLLRLPLAAIVPADPAALPWLLAFSAVTALGPQFLFALCAPRIGPVRTAIAGSMELVSMLAVAVIAYAEALSRTQMLAAILIIVAVGLGARSRRGLPGAA